MRTLRILFHMARADFLERSRRYSFLVTLALCIYAAHGFLPPNDSAYVTLQMGGYRGLYNSAWVGSLVALMTATFLSLVGFYLVKNAVARDRDSRVGEILAGTPIGKITYTVGKTISNALVLAAMTGVVATAAGLMQVVRAEDTHLELWPLLAPFIILTLPAITLTAATAVLFETLPLLRGGLGNIIYFFVWVGALVGGGTISDTFKDPGNDWMGRGVVLPSMITAAEAAYPDFNPDSSSFTMGITFRDGGWNVSTFRWEGVRWTTAVIGARSVWIMAALALAMVAAVPFDRFDPAQGWQRRARAPTRTKRRRRWWMPWDREDDDASEPMQPELTSPARLPSLTPGAAAAAPWQKFTTLVAAELKLMLRDQGRWWYLVLGGLLIASVATPLATAQLRVLPLLWVWPMLVWSPMGTREVRHRTDQILFSAPHPIGVQLAASWASGFALALATGAIVALRLAAVGDVAGLGSMLVGAAFIPALALALGVLTGTARTFEALYIIWWYTGPLQPVPVLDFMGASRAASEMGMPQVYFALTLALLALAALGRRARLRS